MAYICGSRPTTIGFDAAAVRVSRVYDLTDIFLFRGCTRSAGKDDLMRLYAVHYGFARQFGDRGTGGHRTSQKLLTCPPSATDRSPPRPKPPFNLPSSTLDSHIAQ
jgi:hypothetical protein